MDILNTTINIVTGQNTVSPKIKDNVTHLILNQLLQMLIRPLKYHHMYLKKRLQCLQILWACAGLILLLVMLSQTTDLLNYQI